MQNIKETAKKIAINKSKGKNNDDIAILQALLLRSDAIGKMEFVK